MRRSILRWCAAAALLAPAAPSGANYPIFSQRYAADPSPLVHAGRVYVFASHDQDSQTGWDMTDFTCISSDDLVNWTDHGEVFDATRDTSWARRAWAPVVVERDGRFFLYFTDARDGTGVAVAESVLGPYRDPLGEPLARIGDFSDPAVLLDGARAWLHLRHAVRAELDPDMTRLTAPLAGYPSSSFPDYKEGGSVQRIADRYNISWSTPPLPGYGPSYAQSVSDFSDHGFVPAGRWFWSPAEAAANTHGDIFWFAGRSYFVYHNAAVANARGEGSGFQRSLAIDRVFFDADSTIRPLTSSRDWMAQVRFVDPYRLQEAEMMAAESGVECAPSAAGGRHLGSLESGDWTRVQGVDFGAGAQALELRVVNGAAEPAEVEVRLDHRLSGRRIASCLVPPTSGWQDWRTVTCPVSGASGVHDIYFIFRGTPGRELIRFDGWQFSGGPAAGRPPSPTVDVSVCLRALGDPALPERPYLLHDNQDGTWSFQSLADRQFLTLLDPPAGTIGHGLARDAQASFSLFSNPDGSFCLRAANGRFVLAGGGALRATFDEPSAGSPRELAGSQALFALPACTSGSMRDCDLAAVDAPADRSASPALAAVFGNPCARVDASLAEGRVALRRPEAAPGAAFDSASGSAGTITWYQLGCGCDDVIRLRRDATRGTIVLE